MMIGDSFQLDLSGPAISPSWNTNLNCSYSSSIIVEKKATRHHFKSPQMYAVTGMKEGA